MNQKTLGWLVTVVVAVLTSQLVMNYDQVARRFWSWQACNSSVGGFSVEMPGRATEEIKSMPLPVLHTTLQTHNFPVDTAAAYFMTSYVDYPDDLVFDPEKALTGARDGAVANMHAELVSSEMTESNGLPAIQMTARTPKGATVNAMCVLKRNRLYMLMVIANKPHTEDAQRFFKSFKTL